MVAYHCNDQIWLIVLSRWDLLQVEFRVLNVYCKKKCVDLTHFGYLIFILFHIIGEFH